MGVLAGPGVCACEAKDPTWGSVHPQLPQRPHCPQFRRQGHGSSSEALVRNPPLSWVPSLAELLWLPTGVPLSLLAVPEATPSSSPCGPSDPAAECSCDQILGQQNL